ncbi:MAG: hypothetical protein IT323_14260 [Anaerolineae bacterium]|nr:hypothetical protein [Anaerolineae bacterium]
MVRRRFFGDIPRAVLTAAIVVGGILGLILTDRFRWGVWESFFFTLIIAGLLLLATTAVYRALFRRQQKG